MKGEMVGVRVMFAIPRLSCKPLQNPDADLPIGIAVNRHRK
jgi:hypothetical protein